MKSHIMCLKYSFFVFDLFRMLVVINLAFNSTTMNVKNPYIHFPYLKGNITFWSCWNKEFLSGDSILTS